MVLLLGCRGNNAAAYWIAELGWSHLWLNFRFFSLLLFYFYYPSTSPSPPFPFTGTPHAVAGTNPSLQLPFPEGFSRSGPASLAPRMSCFAQAHWQFQQIEEEAKRANFPQNFVRSGSSYSAVPLTTRGKVTADTSPVCTIIIDGSEHTNHDWMQMASTTSNWA